MPGSTSPRMSPRSLLISLWGLGLAWHALAGFVVLLAMSVYVKRPGYGCMYDEGRYALQAISLAERDAWFLPDRTRWIDAEGKSNPDPEYRKHPFYPWLLSKGYRLFGNFGLVLPSVLGTVLAGVSAWLLLGAQSGSWRRAGFWLTLLCTPLYVYSGLIFGHTLGSAAVLIALRTEGTLLLAAMGAALGIEAFRRPEKRRRNLMALLACGATFISWMLLERSWRTSIGGDSWYVYLDSNRVAKPVLGTFKALLGPAAPINHWANFLLLPTALTIPILGRKCREGRWKAAAAFAPLPVAGYLLWAGSWQVAWVSGLILTCPLLWFGLWCRPRDPWPRDLLLLAGAGSLFLLAVGATQGSVGAGLEWGGRYLAIGLPILVLLSVSSLASLFSSAPLHARVAIGVVGIAVSLLVLANATHLLRISHSRNREHSAELTRIAAQADAAGPHPVNGNQPILLTNHTLLPMIDWPDYERFNWVLTQRRAPQYYLERLREHSVGGFLLIEFTRTKDPFLPELASFGYEVRESKAYPTFSVHLVLTCGP